MSSHPSYRPVSCNARKHSFNSGYLPWPTQYYRFNQPHILGARYNELSSSVLSLLHSLYSSLLGPDIGPRILFSNTLSLRSSLNVRDHVSQPRSLTAYITVVMRGKGIK